MVGLDRLTLRRGQVLEQLDRRSECGRLDDSERLLVQLDRLHRKPPPRLVLNATPTQGLIQLVACDREQPGLRRLRSGPEARHRGERGGERLGRKVERLLGPGYAAPEEGEHRGEMPLVEHTERLSTRTRFHQKLRI